MDAINTSPTPDMVTPLKQMVHNKNISEQAKLAKASQQFEAMMLKQILEDGLKPLFKGALDTNKGSQGMYQHMITDSLSQELAKSESFGIANSIQHQMENRVSNRISTEEMLTRFKNK